MRRKPPVQLRAARRFSNWRAAVTGGQPENLGFLLGHVFDVVVHPARDRIAISTRNVKAELWLMENFLPATSAVR